MLATSTSSSSSSQQLLNAHAALKEKVISARKEHQKILSRFPSPPPAFASISSDPIRLVVGESELPEAPLQHLNSKQSSSKSSSSSSTSLDLKESLLTHKRILRDDLSAEKRERAIRYQNYSPEEETIRNDYSQRYVDGGEWPQNWVLGAEPEHRFEE